MDNPKELLGQVEKFHLDLLNYKQLLIQGSRDAPLLRSDLNTRWGELQDDLTELGISRFWTGSGRTFPTFETALTVINERSVLNVKVFLESIDYAVAALEIVEGKLRRILKQQSQQRKGPSITSQMTSQRGRKVFIVHGHDVALRESVARFLEKLELESVILGEQPEQGQTVIEKFEKHADVTYAVVLLTPDDMGYVATASSESAQPRARQNVVLELGYFMAQLGRENIALLQASQLELPSNLSGVLNVSTESEDWKLRLAKELKSVGFDIDLNKIIEQKQ